MMVIAGFDLRVFSHFFDIDLSFLGFFPEKESVGVNAVF